MTTVNTISIDRSKQTQVKKHINAVFVHFQKAKTKMLLSAYYQWYKSNPNYNSTQLSEFNSCVRKNKDEISTKAKKTVGTVYGDKYAIMLTKFILENSIFEDQLIKIAKELTELSKFEGKGSLGFSNLFTKIEIEMIKDIFKLLRSKKGKIDVIETPGEEKERIKEQEKIIKIEELKKSYFVNNKFTVKAEPTVEKKPSNVKKEKFTFVYDKLPVEKEFSGDSNKTNQNDVPKFENLLKQANFERISRKNSLVKKDSASTKHSKKTLSVTNSEVPTVALSVESVNTLAECMTALSMSVNDITKSIEK